MINFQNEEFTPTFEISLLIRDSLGRPTGKRRSLKASDGNAIFEFWSRYQGKPKRHKKTVKNISEGKRNKGGQNKPPHTSRPSEPLRGQG